jgi:AmmeMemoRadiSam system protein B
MRSSGTNTSVRPPAVADFFYPGDPVELRDMLNRLIAEAPQTAAPSHAKSYIVPHAGYIYSGIVAAAAYAHMQRSGFEPRRIVVIGPSHRVYLRGVALPEAGAFRTPLGDIPVDAEARRALLERGDVVVSDIPHAQEHSLEVQLPFLQHLFEGFELVPLVVGAADAGHVASVLATVANDESTLVLASSDLSHYLTYEQARRVDAETHERIMAFADDLRGEQACGAVVLNGLLRLAKQREAAISCLSSMNSGDTAGDRSRVVGYAAYAIYDDRSRRPQ